MTKDNWLVREATSARERVRDWPQWMKTAADLEPFGHQHGMMSDRRLGEPELERQGIASDEIKIADTRR